MDAKKIIISGVVAGIAMFIGMIIINTLTQFVMPYDIMTIGGMRAIEDPLMMLFFLSPWVYAFTMAILYSFVGGSFKGTFMQKGRTFGLLMFLVITIPSFFIVYTSMTYPNGFYLDQVVGGLVEMLLGGIVIAKFMG
jgi:hypothetical protein